MRCTPSAAVLILSLALSTTAGAQSFASASGEIDSRLKSALSELSSTRDRIAKERIPLSRAVSNLEKEVLRLRQKRTELYKVRDSRGVDLTSLRKQVDLLREQDEFINSRLNEFVRDFESRLDISELPLYEKKTEAAKLAQKNVNLDAEEKRSVQVAVVKAAVNRLSEQLGGQVYAGEALSPEGVLTAGKFVSMGPTVFFASDDKRVVGLVENQLNAADPVVVALPASLREGVIDLANEGRGLLPFDATLGKALKIEKARKGVLDYVREGGAVGYVIIALGFAALLLTGFKTFEILSFRVAEAGQVDDVLEALANGNHTAASSEARQIGGIAGEMLETGVDHAAEKRGVLEELLFEKVLRVRPSLERYLPFLAIVAAAAPLLGLLGTVVGMIKTFQLITIFGTGDAKSLSSGISEALVTTALGLIVAIPTLILHGMLSRMAKRKIGLLEQLSVAFVNGLGSIRSRLQVGHPALQGARDLDDEGDR